VKGPPINTPVTTVLDVRLSEMIACALISMGMAVAFAAGRVCTSQQVRSALLRAVVAVQSWPLPATQTWSSPPAAPVVETGNVSTSLAKQSAKLIEFCLSCSIGPLLRSVGTPLLPMLITVPNCAFALAGISSRTSAAHARARVTTNARTLSYGSTGPDVAALRSRLRQQPIELIGKRLAFARAEHGRAARIDAGAAQFVHEIAHRQALRDGLGGIELAARMHRQRAFLDDQRRQRNILCNHQIMRAQPLHDFVVGHIQARGHLHGTYESRRRRAQPLVGYQGDVDLLALGGTKQDFLDRHRTGVGIHPDLRRLAHSLPFQCTWPSMTVLVLPPTQMAPSIRTSSCAL